MIAETIERSSMICVRRVKSMMFGNISDDLFSLFRARLSLVERCCSRSPLVSGVNGAVLVLRFCIAPLKFAAL